MAWEVSPPADMHPPVSINVIFPDDFSVFDGPGSQSVQLGRRRFALSGVSLPALQRQEHMPYSRNYPATVAEVLRPIKLRSFTVRALRAFARSKPWAGTMAQRQAKSRTLHDQLCRTYGIQPTLVFGNDDTSDSGRSCFIPGMNTIVLRGRLSVVTYLHEFSHARGMDERQAVSWSASAFRRFFPKSFGRCSQVAHTLRARRPS